MAYNRNIPQSTDLISNSQSDLLSNFQAIDSGTTGTGIGFSRNHVTLTDATNGGLHHEVDFYQNVSDPTISGFVSSLYPKLVGSDSQLFFRNGAEIIQLTGTSTVGSSGSVTLQGGVVLKWATTTATDNTIIPFVVAFPASCFGVVVTPLAATSPATFVTVSASPIAAGFTPRVKNNAGSAASPISIFYIAIGV